MSFDDNRDFMRKLEEEGQLVHVKQQVDWNEEAGAIVRRISEGGHPAALFENIRDYPNWRIAGALMSATRRVAISMGLPSDTPPRTLVDEFDRRTRNPIKPVSVSTGPCKENILVGDKVDLFALPAPLIHAPDAGRYLCTWHAVISKDPDSDWVNWGMYRGMIHEKDKLGILLQPAQQIGLMYYQKYEARNQPMDVAIAIGMDPLSSLSACTFFPARVNEADMAGGLRGKPVELVKCETVDLEVPATSEIVIEGKVYPHDRIEEGPFGEYTGYLATERAPRPFVQVTAITHRNNPILTMSCEGVPVTETHATMSVSKSASIQRDLRDRGFPVTGVWASPESADQLIVVGTKVAYGNIADAIAHAVFASPGGLQTPWLVVVPDDVDPYSWPEVCHAMWTRCHPFRGVRRIEYGTGNFLNPRVPLRERRLGLSAKCYFDCTWPVDWSADDTPKSISFNTAYSPDVRDRVLKNWRSYGFEETGG